MRVLKKRRTFERERTAFLGQEDGAVICCAGSFEEVCKPQEELQHVRIGRTLIQRFTHTSSTLK